MSKMTYRQCELRQPTEQGYLRYVAWLPSDKVIVGRKVRIDDIEGVWLIESAGEPRDKKIVEAYADNAHRGLPSVSGHDKENA